MILLANMTEKGKIVKGAVVINIHIEGSPFHPPQKGDTEKVDIIPDIGQDPKVPVEDVEDQGQGQSVLREGAEGGVHSLLL